jgi:hypothetical protein
MDNVFSTGTASAKFCATDRESVCSNILIQLFLYYETLIYYKKLTFLD